MMGKREPAENAYAGVLQDPRDRVNATLPEPEPPAMEAYILRYRVYGGATRIGRLSHRRSNPPPGGRCGTTALKGAKRAPTSRSDVYASGKTGWPTAREGQGHGVLVVVVGVTPHQGGR
jgi:hypothetical protein